MLCVWLYPVYRLIHVAGTVSGAPELNDGELGVSAVGTVLERVVQMKQWKEHERKRTVKLGNGQERVEKEWTYSKEWASQPINSDNFKEGGTRMHAASKHRGASAYLYIVVLLQLFVSFSFSFTFSFSLSLSLSSSFFPLSSSPFHQSVLCFPVYTRLPTMVVFFGCPF